MDICRGAEVVEDQVPPWSTELALRLELAFVKSQSSAPTVGDTTTKYSVEGDSGTFNPVIENGEKNCPGVPVKMLCVKEPGTLRPDPATLE